MSSKYHHLIDGEWLSSPDYTANLNPADGEEVIGYSAQGDAATVDAAVSTAQRAAPMWACTTSQMRADILDKAGQLLLERASQIGHVLAREEGKTLSEATGETVRAGQVFKFFAGEALRVTGQQIASLRAGVEVGVAREPLGVVGVITPWNFPIAILAWKVAPALAYGNTVVLKPAELTPASAHNLAQILAEAGCPNGVFNLVFGPGETVGEAIVNHPDISAISFTGSQGVGQRISAACGRSQKKIQMEMGGKNPMVILDDADLDHAVDVSVNGAFFSTGQRCTASSRLIVHAGVYDAFAERMVGAIRVLRVGNPLDEMTQIRPVCSKQQLESNLSYVKLARAEHADVIGGEALDSRGFFQKPGLFLNANNSMRTSREEIFGPLASVIKVDSFEEAVCVANDTPFGLSSGICTSSLRRASHFKSQSTAGMVMVNLPTAGVDYHVPFGGRKGSSFGAREQGRMAVEFYSSVKTTYTFSG
ncbi:MAG: aldehyde dehydrogenase family protein [Hyphomicrobiaceae bacterium]|nr:aldehyde dehydrogenase family protein [Hyphomicrobiaceae bacterium]